MLIQSARLGEMEVSDEAVVQFPNGLPGFREMRSFAFIPFGPDSPFSYLQSTADADLMFIVLETFAVFPDYTFEVDDAVAAELGFSLDNAPQTFSIVTIPDQLDQMTANLVAPLLVNWRDRLAVQYVLEQTKYSVKQRIFPNGLPKEPTDETGKGR
ncbi:MAG TPA: flagellar assembly protein FliW [Patescibacteria group bacterium]|nr:flagellar assembly protein FliW [Patescibacteria group bacterium]